MYGRVLYTNLTNVFPVFILATFVAKTLVFNFFHCENCILEIFIICNRVKL